MKSIRYFGILFCGILLALANARASSSALHSSPMLSCSGLPCVDVALSNGKHLRMLVDLGDSHSVVDSTVAKSLGLTVTPAQVADSQGNHHSSYGQATLDGAKLGDASLGSIQVLVMDLAPMIQKNQMPQADGSLAYSAFKDRLVQLDYKHKMVRVSDPLTEQIKCPGFCGDITMPTFGNKGPHVLVTTGFSVNGKPIVAQVDPLFSGTMLIYPGSIEKLGLLTASGVNAKQFFPFTDGGVSMLEGRAASEAFGPKSLAHNAGLFFATPQVHVPDGLFDGTVGAGLLNGHIVNFDLHGNHFWLTN